MGIKEQELERLRRLDPILEKFMNEHHDPATGEFASGSSSGASRSSGSAKTEALRAKLIALQASNAATRQSISETHARTEALKSSISETQKKTDQLKSATSARDVARKADMEALVAIQGSHDANLKAQEKAFNRLDAHIDDNPGQSENHPSQQKLRDTWRRAVAKSAISGKSLQTTVEKLAAKVKMA